MMRTGSRPTLHRSAAHAAPPLFLSLAHSLCFQHTRMQAQHTHTASRDGLLARVPQYEDWAQSVTKQLKKGRGKLVILEAGCGIRVPTVREMSEKLLADTADHGSVLIR